MVLDLQVAYHKPMLAYGVVPLENQLAWPLTNKPVSSITSTCIFADIDKFLHDFELPPGPKNTLRLPNPSYESMHLSKL